MGTLVLTLPAVPVAVLVAVAVTVVAVSLVVVSPVAVSLVAVSPVAVTAAAPRGGPAGEALGGSAIGAVRAVVSCRNHMALAFPWRVAGVGAAKRL